MKRRLLLTLLITLSLHAQQEKIKLYAIYTPSHEKLAHDWFLPSIQDDYQLVLEKWEQTESSGNAFMENGWMEAIFKKVDFIIRAVKENWGGIFVFSDVDIQFFGPTQELILDAMQGNDIVLQKDEPGGALCTGFFACRCNEKTLKLWHAVKQYITQIPDQHDQHGLNYFTRHTNPYDIKWDYLPVVFCGGGTINGRVWKPGMSIPIPDGIVMHHANYTVGNENKIEQLKYVRALITNRHATDSTQK